jgi:hypothetical protein
VCLSGIRTAPSCSERRSYDVREWNVRSHSRRQFRQSGYTGSSSNGPILILDYKYCLRVGRDSSVGIATRYGLYGPGTESRCRSDFPHPFRLALGPTEPPVQRVPGIFRRGRAVEAWR